MYNYTHMLKYRIGCSGFLYDSWRGNFYPETLPQKRWLTYYVSKINSVELNVTFYRLLKKEAFERWYKETPPNFSFSLKGSRFITHIKKLKDVELPLLTFFNTTAPLLEKLDVVLWQLPPNFRVNMKNLEDFIEAIKLYPVRHVFEFRHKSWISKKVFKLLASANIAACMADWPEFIDDLPITADFVYIRRHGEFGSYSTDYTPEQLKSDAKRIKDYLKLGKDVYFYFNNDSMGYAPKNVMELIAMIKGSLPKALERSLRPEGTEPKKKSKSAAARKPSGKKIKPAKKGRKKTVKKLKKKKTVKKPKTVKKVKPRRSKPKKVKTKKVARKSTKKTVRKKTTKKVTKKNVKKKIVKKPAKKKLKRTGVKKKTTKKVTNKKKAVKKKQLKKTSKKPLRKRSSAKPGASRRNKR
jgi:uncharacterized protein YecE (DUF72 family)